MLRPIETRFWEKVARWGAADTDCWEWAGAKNPLGYGKLGIPGGHVEAAHRVSWTLTNGPIPEGMCVLHRCDNPPCVNPEHLWLGTHLDNMRDRDVKGRRKGPQRKTHCIRGHLFDEENTYIYPNPKHARECRACHRQRVTEKATHD